MKTKIFLTILILFLASVSWADELETVQPPAKLIKTSNSNDAALGVDGTSWAVASGWPLLSVKSNALKVKFYVYDSNTSGPNDTTFSYEFYVADYGCNAEKVAAGSATCGAAQLSHDPANPLAELNSGDPNSLYCWVDTLGTITTDWASLLLKQNDGGLNDVASFIFDRQTAKKAWCRIYNRSRSTMTVYCVIYYY